MKNRKNQFTIILLALGAFVTGTGEFVVSGILELISFDLGVSIATTGQLITIYALSYAIGALVLVMLTSKFDRKKVLLFAISTVVAGNLIAFFSYHFAVLMAARVVQAMSGGLFIVIATNYAAQIAAPERKGSAMATVLTGFTISLVLGVPIGTFLAGYIDWRYVFLIIALGTVLLLAGLYKLLPAIEGNPSPPFKQQLQIIKDKRVLSGLMTTIFGF